MKCKHYKSIFVTFEMINIATTIRKSSTMVRDKIKNWNRVPHYNVLCIGNTSHGKTKLTHELSGLSYEDLARQSGSLNQEEDKDGKKATMSTCLVEYEFNNQVFDPKVSEKRFKGRFLFCPSTLFNQEKPIIIYHDRNSNSAMPQQWHK